MEEFHKNTSQLVYVIIISIMQFDYKTFYAGYSVRLYIGGRISITANLFSVHEDLKLK